MEEDAARTQTGGAGPAWLEGIACPQRRTSRNHATRCMIAPAMRGSMRGIAGRPDQHLGSTRAVSQEPRSRS